MKRPVQLVEDILRKSIFPFDDIFLDAIPQEELKNTNKTQVLLTEATNSPSEYGNSMFTSFDYGVYVQIFYTNSLDVNIDTTEKEIELMEHFINNEWLISQSQAHYLDPETGQMIKNLIVQRTMTLREVANS